MSFDHERRAIENRFAANYSATGVKYENVPFDQPDNSSWVAITVLSGEGQTASIGTGSSQLKRFSGIIQMDVYTVEDGGTSGGRQLADTIATIFDNVQFSSGSSGTITTRVPSFATRGVENGWHHSVVSVAYHRSNFT